MPEQDQKILKAIIKKKRYESLLKHFPIQLKKVKDKGRCVIAADGIDAGTLVMDEAPVAFALFKDAMGSVCSVCLHQIKDLPIACLKCRKQSFYCSSDCQSKDVIHDSECEIITHLPGIAGAHSVDYSLLRLIVRFIISRSFYKSDGSPLMDYFECVRDMVGHKSSASQEWIASIRNAALDLFDSFPGKLNSSVDEMIQLACQINSNSFVLYDPFSPQQSELGVSLLPLSALFNHSCSPNAIMYTDSLGHNIIRTVQNVSKGEELTISYIDLNLPVMERRGKLLETKNFWCTCHRCESQSNNEDIDSVLCFNCKTILHYSDGFYVCSECDRKISSEKHQSIQNEVIRDFESAADFLKIGNIRGAQAALCRFQESNRVSNQHYLVFNSLCTLINCCVKLQEYSDAITNTRKVISIMNDFKFLPENWPEKADYFFRLGELLEIQQLIDGDSVDLGKDIYDAFFECWKIRNIAFGSDHPATLAAFECLSPQTAQGLLNAVPLMSKTPKYIAAIDQGTSSSRFMVFDLSGNVVASSQQELPQLYPQPGWVEQDPLQILSTVTQCIQQTALNMTDNKLSVADIQSIGITNQRETTIVWDKITGEPLHNAIVWLDTRTQSLVDDFLSKSSKEELQHLCGLPISTYFSALKLKWLLKNIPNVQKAADEDRLQFGNFKVFIKGTVDSWLIYRLCGGVSRGPHVTDVTNASRTMLMSLDTLNWDDSLCNFFNIPQSALPVIKSSSEVYGLVEKGPLKGIPISGCLGDQQSALVGQGCLQPGMIKNTYGTGCFMLYNTGPTPVYSRHGLLTTVAYKFGNDAPVYALEGSVAVAGAAVNWLKDNLQIIKEPAEVSVYASQVTDNAGVYFVPAFSGLFAPYWKEARGCIVGLTQYSTKQHLCLAALEAICFQSKEIIDAMNLDFKGSEIKSLNVDGGLTKSSLLLQIQADILGVPVHCPNMMEITALGAALAGALGAGVFKSLSEFTPAFSQVTYQPKTAQKDRAESLKMWKRAIEKAMITD